MPTSAVFRSAPGSITVTGTFIAHVLAGGGKPERLKAALRQFVDQTFPWPSEKAGVEAQIAAVQPPYRSPADVELKRSEPIAVRDGMLGCQGP